MKNGCFWADLLKKRKEEHKALVAKVQPIEAKLKPLQEQINTIREKMTPLVKEVSPMHDQLRTLDFNIKRAEAWAYLESLKEGSKVWIIHIQFMVTADDRGLYETISDEQAQKRFVDRERKRERKERLGHVPHELVIESKGKHLGQMTFTAKDNKGRLYSGVVKSGGVASFKMAPSGMPKLMWRRGSVF